MPEIGLLPFARVALDVAAAVLPPYRSRFSKHQFTQPQLLAVLCLMRYEDWTFRETEVRLREHRELRETLKLSSVPDYTTLYRFLQRLDDQTIDRVLGEAARRFKSPKRRTRRRARVAVDGTGLSHNAASTFFYSPHRAAATRNDALELLVEVVDRHRSGQADDSGPARTASTLVRLPESARFGGCGQRSFANRVGVGRRRI